ncbi:DUF2726 domain-containing protein [Sinirhodobacter populi]|uniref:DUF2726 domain-containing protein n=1 Tax=Paenirhodobacter populi TaxID=2306993 RepID=A0A443KCH8_9RHOB|nr:DUF2726 domain-containing protein [Sinirhodobacter populi]RWR30539.1 DUF2726 domain-containing protein [Sinirhodobacter populi]
MEESIFLISFLLLFGCVFIVFQKDLSELAGKSKTGEAPVAGVGENETLPEYRAQPIINGSELKLYYKLERWRRKHAPNHSLSVQVKYGSFITASSPKIRGLVQNSVADFVLWGPDRYVRVIIEFDGAGHYGDSLTDAAAAKERDRKKNAAALSANIPLIRVGQDTPEGEIEQALIKVLKIAPSPVIVQAEVDRVDHVKV